MDSTAADRQKRYRERQRASVAIVPVPVDEAMVEQLIADGHLSPKESENRESIGRGIRSVLAKALEAVK